MPLLCFNFQRGSVTLYVLIMMIVFVIITSSSIQYISRQSHQTVNQEQEEQAFALADAGVQYVLWLLTVANGDEGGYSPSELTSNPISAYLFNHIITDNNGDPIGRYSVNIIQGETSANTVTIKSIGRSNNLPELCQVINATYFKPSADENFRLTAWDHEVGYNCFPQINDCDVIELTVGSHHNSNLQVSSCTSTTSHNQDATINPANFYKIIGEVQDNVQIEAGSPQFNPHITLINPGGSPLAQHYRAAVQTIARYLPFNLFTFLEASAHDNIGCDLLSTNFFCVNHIFTQTDHFLELSIDNLANFTIESNSQGQITTALPYRLQIALTSACKDGIDNDGDGTADFAGTDNFVADPGCASADDGSEYNLAVECDNGIDDDDDGDIDYRDAGGDSDCESLTDPTEGDACQPIPIAFNTITEGILDNSCIIAAGQGDEGKKFDKYTFNSNGDMIWIDLRSNAFDTKIRLRRGTGSLGTQSSCLDQSHSVNDTCWLSSAFTNLTPEIKIPNFYGLSINPVDYTIEVIDEDNSSSGGSYTISLNKCEISTLTATVGETINLSGSLNSSDCVVAHQAGGSSDIDSFIDIYELLIPSGGLRQITASSTTPDTDKIYIYALLNNNLHAEVADLGSGASISLAPQGEDIYTLVVTSVNSSDDPNGSFTYNLEVQ